MAKPSLAQAWLAAYELAVWQGGAQLAGQARVFARELGRQAWSLVALL